MISDKHASLLVCGGGTLDKNILGKAGFSNVTISNLDSRMAGNEYAPFKWSFENAEQLSFEDSSFDYVVIHAAIHHASSPHKVITEMYRVASKGILAFEARDSFVMRLMEKFGFAQVYEHAAVYYNGCKFGGVNNTEIPNYIYRWTEREIEKTIKSYAPAFQHRFIYRYGSALPYSPKLERNKIKYFMIMLARPFYYLFTRIFPRQQNLFAFFVEKPDIQYRLFPWLNFDKKKNKITFNRSWGDQKYEKQ